MDEATKIRREVDLSGASAGSGQPKKSGGGASCTTTTTTTYHCMLWKLSAVGGRGGGWISSAYGEAEAPLGTE
jgi:hypothetical protein